VNPKGRVQSGRVARGSIAGRFWGEGDVGGVFLQAKVACNPIQFVEGLRGLAYNLVDWIDPGRNIYMNS